MATKKVEKKYCIECVKKGHKKLQPLTNFYVSKESADGRVDLCKKCYLEMSLNDDDTMNIEGFKEALRIMNKPYDESVLRSAIEQAKRGGKTTSNPAQNYMRLCNSLPQNSGEDFAGSVEKTTKNNIEKEKNTLNAKINKEEKKNESVVWGNRDKQNKKFVIETFGYDPFEDSVMTEKDRKHSYNILAGYCDTDGISEDGHKLQAILRLASNAVQSEHIDDLINEENAKEHPDVKKIKDLTSTNKSLMDTNAKLATDNNICAKTNKDVRTGSDTFTSKTKEMQLAGVFEVEPNIIDAKMTEVYRTLDKLSLENIREQILLGENEYAELLKDATEFNRELQEKNDKLFEENRNVKNENIRLRKLLKDAGVDV